MILSFVDLWKRTTSASGEGRGDGSEERGDGGTGGKNHRTKLPEAQLGHARAPFEARARAPSTMYAVSVRLSTIAKHAEGSAFAGLLGSEIRRRRSDLGLSQAFVGRPMGRAFVSSVERGRSTPSLPSLLIIARRLNTSAAAILAVVEPQMEDLSDLGNRS